MAHADDPRIPTLIHPRAVSTTSLPAHASLRDPESRPIHRPSLPHFIHSVLTEGHLLATTINDDIFVAGAPRRVNGVNAKIQVYKRPMRRDHQPLIVGEAIPRAEHWYGRQSAHKNENVEGTVMYSEFKRFLKNGYVDWKAKYVPDVVSTNKLFEYDCQRLEFERFRDITASGGLRPSLLRCVQLIKRISPRPDPKEFSGLSSDLSLPCHHRCHTIRYRSSRTSAGYPTQECSTSSTKPAQVEPRNQPAYPHVRRNWTHHVSKRCPDG